MWRITSLFGNIQNVTSKPKDPFGTETRMLKNTPEDISKDQKNTIRRRKLSTKMDTMDASKWVMCRTIPFYFCYRVAGKGLKITTRKKQDISEENYKSAIILRRYITHEIQAQHRIY